MYAVIFKAMIGKQDEQYVQTAQRMQVLAKEKYACVDFVSVTEGQSEIAISYWQNLSDIKRWKEDPEHKQAQKLGAEKWYQSYQVEVVEIMRTYSSANQED